MKEVESANSVDSNEGTHDEPLHLHLHRLLFVL